MKFAIIGFCFLTAVGVLLGIAIAEASVPMLSVREVLEQRHAGEACRVDGVIIASIEALADPLTFTTIDEGVPNRRLKVVSSAPAPDNFKVGIRVGVHGVFDAQAGVFRAVQVSTQCPSKYEGKGAKGAKPGAAPADPLLFPPPLPANGASPENR
jgi:cytochrome c-type biogenesis protein CcmE